MHIRRDAQACDACDCNQRSKFSLPKLCHLHRLGWKQRQGTLTPWPVISLYFSFQSSDWLFIWFYILLLVLAPPAFVPGLRSGKKYSVGFVLPSFSQFCNNTLSDKNKYSVLALLPLKCLLIGREQGKKWKSYKIKKQSAARSKRVTRNQLKGNPASHTTPRYRARSRKRFYNLRPRKSTQG